MPEIAEIVSLKHKNCVCWGVSMERFLCAHTWETMGESKDPGAATELTCSYCEYTLSLVTGWAWWHRPVAVLPLLGHQILQLSTRGNIRK